MKSFIYPVLALLAVLSLVFVGTKVLFDNISGLNASLGENRKTENSLQNKLTSLQAISPKVTADSQAAIAALPESNPALFVVSQIRSQSRSLGLTLNSFSFGGIAGSTILNKGLSSGEITFEIGGSYKNIAALIDSMKNSAPLVRFDSIKILNQSALGGGVYKFTGDVFSYWAKLPTNLPALSQPFEELSSDEQKILSQISSLNVLTSATVASSPSAGVASNRPDPFSL